MNIFRTIKTPFFQMKDFDHVSFLKQAECTHQGQLSHAVSAQLAKSPRSLFY